MPIRALLLLSAACLPLAAPCTALAQSAVLDDITVKAQSKAAANAPAGTTNSTVTDAEITQSQAGTLNDALRNAPSVTTAQRGNLLRSLPNIRGFGGTTHYASDPSTQIALDGVATSGSRLYQNATDMVIDPALLKSATVLTGPLASLEYGSGIAGGTVALETVNGADLTGGATGVKLRQLVGANSNGDGWVTSTSLGWKANDSFDLLLNYARRSQGEQEDGDGALTKAEGFNVPSFLIKARYRMDDAQTLTLSHTNSESAERDVPYAQATGSTSSAFGNVNRDRKGTVTTLSYGFKPEGNDLVDTELQLSKSDQEVRVQSLLTGNYAESVSGLYDLETERVTLKNTARFATGDVSHKLRAGLDWSHQSKALLDRTSRNSTTPDADLYRQGVFAIDDMEFGQEWRASLGLRWETQRIAGHTPSTAYGPYETEARTAGFGLEKGLGHGFTAFGSATYSEGFASLDTFHQLWALSDERYGQMVQQNRNYELGVKYEGAGVMAAGDSLSASVSAYQTDVRNALYGPSSGRSAATSIANSTGYLAYEMRGLEASARYEQESGLYAQAILNFTDNSELYKTAATTKWRDYMYSPAPSARITLGKKLQSGLDLSWSVQGAKSFDITSTTGTAQTPITTHYAGWGVNDLALRYTPSSTLFAGTSIDFAVENIFDKVYKPTLNYNNEPGRNFKLTLAKTF